MPSSDTHPADPAYVPPSVRCPACWGDEMEAECGLCSGDGFLLAGDDSLAAVEWAEARGILVELLRED